jgi:putative DNA primase/helicase
LHLDALDGFHLSGLQSASLVLVDETPTRIDEQRLKTLISGDSLQANIKYRDPLTLRPTAKWIVNGNALPAISDHSTGFWRRWLIFPFTVVPRQIIPLLGETICDKELAGVLNWCIGGLVRLLQRGRFPVLPEEMAQATRDGKQASNNVAEWVVDFGVVTDDNCRNTRRSIYAWYAAWCGESGTKVVSAKKFWDRLEEALPDLKIEREQRGGERAFWVNIPTPPASERM